MDKIEVNSAVMLVYWIKTIEDKDRLTYLFGVNHIILDEREAYGVAGRGMAFNCHLH